MLLRASNHCASLVIMSMIALAPCARVVTHDDYVLSALRHWWRDWAGPPWIPLVGDADGDGRADLVAVGPGGAISVERTSPLGKWVLDPEPNTRFGNDPVAATVGRFTGDAADEVLALGRDGSLRLAFGMKRGTRTYTRDLRVGEVPAADVPTSVAPRPDRRHQPRRAHRRARPTRRRPAARALEPQGRRRTTAV